MKSSRYIVSVRLCSPLWVGVNTPNQASFPRAVSFFLSFTRGQLDTHKKVVSYFFTPPLVPEVGQLSTDPASERALVVVVVGLVVVTTALTATSGAGGSVPVTSRGVASRGVTVARCCVGIAAVLATTLAPVASLGLSSGVGVSARVGVVAGVVVAASSRGGRRGGVEGGGLDGGLLDDGVGDVEDLLDFLVGSHTLSASLLLVGGDGGVQVLLVLGDLLVNAVECLCRADLGGDVCLRSGAGLLDGEASAEGTGQGVVSASDCADVSS